MISSQYRRRVCAALAAALALTATTTEMAGTAAAGEYPLYSCDYPGSTNTGQRVWTVASGSYVGASCPNFTAHDAGGVAPPLTVAGWRATAPAGAVSIQGLELTGSLQGGNGSWQFYIPQASAAICAGTHETTCVGSPLTPTVVMPAGTKLADVQIRCVTGAGECSYYNASVKPKLTLSENIAPSASITGGSLVGGGPQSGSRTLTWDAADADSGVARTKVTLGGTTVFEADHTRTSACSFDTWSPCALTQGSSGPVSVDTTQVANGTQQLELSITDAAGNTKADTRSVEICNSCTGRAPGSGGSSGSASPASPNTGTRTLNGAVEGKSLLARFTGSKTKLTSSYGKTVKVSGRLVSAVGGPVPSATLEVQTAKRIAGAGFHPTTVVTTDAAGRFTLAVKARSSRIIRFGYRVYREDLAPVQQQDVDLRVRAPIALKVNRRSTRNGRSVRFSGRIAGVATSSRKAVEMQARVGKHWVSFGTARLRGGRFSQGYRFRRTYRPTNYTFRAVVRSDGRWPFETTASRHVRVAVRP